MPDIQIDNTTTHYERGGDGQPLVFVHGLGADCGYWEPTVAELHEAFEVVTYDLRGHGRSTAGDQATLSVDRLAADLHALVDELGLDRPVLCAHSLGCPVVLTYAAEYPDALAGVVCVDGMVTGVSGAGVRLQRTLIGSRPGRWFFRREYHARLLSAVESVAKRVVEPDGEMVRYFEEAPDPDGDAFAKLLLAGLDYEGVDLERVAVPVLGLYSGPESRGDGQAEALADRVPESEVRWSDAGHHLVWEDTETTIAALRSLATEAVDSASRDG